MTVEMWAESKAVRLEVRWADVLAAMTVDWTVGWWVDKKAGQKAVMKADKMEPQ